MHAGICNNVWRDGCGLPRHTSASDWLPMNVIGSDSISQTVVLRKSKPIVFAGIKKSGGKTLYFDGGYVYSDKTNGVFLYDIVIGKTTTNVVNVALKVNYLDYTVNPAGIPESTLVNCDVIATPDPISTIFSKTGQFVCPGGMKIQKTKFIFTKSDSSKKEYVYNCQDNFMVRTGSSLVWYSNNDADRYEIDSIQNLMALYFSPATESFESANFGDGRIVYNTTGTGTSPYSYEYFLTDHLGSTRVVVNDQGNINEAVTYEPYGAMSQVGATSAAIPVRNKFTTKELDQEGGTGSGDGIKLYHFGARFYDPELALWTSTDPAEEFWNAYSYCMGNPINLVDPLGLYTAAVTYLMDEVVIQGTATASQAAIAAAITNIAINIGTQAILNSAMSDATRTIPQPVITNHIEMDPFNVMGPVIDEGTLSQQMFDLAMRDEMVEGMGNAFGGGGLKVVKGAAKSLLKVDPNKAAHIFDQVKHNLNPLVNQFGSKGAAFKALQKSTEAVVKSKGITGVFETTVQVGTETVTVRGNVVNGVVKIGTAFK